MAELLPEGLAWLDSKKRQALAEVATAMAAPETAGSNLWSALRDMGRNVGVVPQEDTGDPVQNARNLMMGFGVGSIHKFPGSGPRIPTYGVTELPQTPELMQKFSRGNVVPFPQEQSATKSMWDLRSNLAEAKWSVDLMRPTILSGKATTEQIRMYNQALRRLETSQAEMPK